MRKFVLLILAVLMTGALFAQSRRVSGTVTNESGEPVIGAAVSVQGTSVTAITDADGSYAISVPADGVLVVSLLGMDPVEVVVGGRSVVDVSMATDAELIDDVIVVAYGLATRESFTGSASTLDSENLEKRQISNVSRALSGAVAGVQGFTTSGQPGSAANVRIRGVGSISSANTPLYVLDGVPFPGDLSSINSADIESMTVLKDASAAAIYGARGANGVILITTKKGRSRDAVVTFDAKWGSNERGTPRYESMTDPGMFFEKLYEAIYNSYLSNPNTAGQSVAELNRQTNARLFGSGTNSGTGYKVYTLPEGQGLIGMNGKLNPNAKLGYNDGEFYYIPDDWYKESFRKKGLRQEYNLSVSGSDERFNYFVSGGYLDDTGFVPNSSFERFTTRLKADYQAKKWLRFTANMSYTSSIQDAPDNQEGSSSGSLFWPAVTMAPVYPMYIRDAEGKIMRDSQNRKAFDYGDGLTVNQVRSVTSGSNALGTLELDMIKYKMDIFGGRWGAEATIIDGLKVQANIGVDLDQTEYTRQDNLLYGPSAGKGYIYKQRARYFYVNQQYLATYHKKWGKHTFDVLAGYESFKREDSNLDGVRDKLYNPNVYELNNGIGTQNSYSSKNTYATQGFLGRVQYDYDGKYYFSGSYRRDASSRFHPDNRWGNFGSLGAAWIVNKEDFFDVSWVDLLKAKVSWGVQGNDQLPNWYPYMDQYALTNSDGDFATSLEYKGNPEITWETSYNFNAGIEFELLKGRLGGNVEFFSRKTVDLLYDMPVSPSAGYATIPVNLGAMRNSGVEIDLYGTIFQKKNFSWEVNVNGTFLKNKIISLTDEAVVDGIWIRKAGESMYNMYIREWAGVAQEDRADDPTTGNVNEAVQAGQALYYQDVKDADGKVIGLSTTSNGAAADLRETGNVMPTFYGGFGTTIYLYGFDISAQFAYQLGGRVYDSTYAQLMGNGRRGGDNWHKDMLGSWTEQNRSTTTPRANVTDSYPNYRSTRFLISSDYLSLNNITVGYTVPKKYTNKIGIGSLRVYFVADNLGYMAARKGLDPRQVLSDDTDAYTYSAIRTLSGGLTVSF